MMSCLHFLIFLMLDVHDLKEETLETNKCRYLCFIKTTSLKQGFFSSIYTNVLFTSC